MLEDEVTDKPVAVNDADTLPPYILNQKDSQRRDYKSRIEHRTIGEILSEYQDIFLDVPKVTNLTEHKVQLTETEPVKHKSYPIPYKMQKDINKEIDDTLATGVIDRSEAPYASPLVVVKKPDNTYRMCINFKEFNKITVFDPEPSDKFETDPTARNFSALSSTEDYTWVGKAQSKNGMALSENGLQL